MAGSELIYRGHEAAPAETTGYSPKPSKRLPWLSRSARYLLGEHRLLFALVGMALASALFLSPAAAPRGSGAAAAAAARAIVVSGAGALVSPHRSGMGGAGAVVMRPGSVGGKVPLGLRRKGLRIVVTGGAGFVGSHLVDRLMERGDSVIVVDNFFTGRKENVVHHFGNPNFELIRHDVVEPILLEVDQIYHLACPASPVHYKFNPVRIARIFNTYGPRMCIDDGRVVSNFVAQVEGLMRLMEGEHVGPFNLGNPGEFTMLELAKVVQDTIDPNARIEFRANTEDDPHKRKPDITRAKELLGWEPKISLRQGLPLMVSDFRKRVFGDHTDSATTASAGGSAGSS
ncbi:UDP-glucuronic acid decarboxylase 2 [Ananas comosus]|uniref:UDP-glucuronic acid decarboxylase 2 n=1 Tax=Ananas comosus TaxID=4615 RepID=A0A199UGM8_ANACO|nr:UDP-glucuronic acid decarboxylase 2 [Ananas comosus]